MMSNWKRLAACGSALLVLGSLVSVGPAYAGGQPREHDGFFMRLSLGGGSGSASIEGGGSKLKLSGGAADMNLAFGGMVSKNLALHGTMWGWGVQDPDADLTLAGLGSGSTSFNGFLAMSAIGAGVTYYAMPANVYLSGSLGIGNLSGSDELDGSTDTGFALDATVGKEWWVGDNWGLGFAGDFTYLSAPDKDLYGSSDNWGVTGFGIRFSATFN
jgi:hypothetical protein